ncbi:hypothetical protein [Dolichospermum circinale]|jgi:hypothetical protein|uniref:Uncharacterized protein n=1 Tax=Dolichospermum circinale CS-537/01 TaxID=3021739 RepID=A0ABT5A2F8_9CYAN|nr:hypothetical protein [Dolichospermum circinale]MDB9454493.1 hypothetical protein [Dolichospermum circinale CS-541/06]MDB9464501.1 hypothetical protein [Dolichospermum circinale CS-541/04]MDB9486106.1 hypothetical protein [Dolichospermum circinale CS-537/01]MDB9546959.1 hypothetical protein [Dolichospermum circinale CS-1031]
MSNEKLVSSPGQNLKTVYEQVFEEIYPHIKEGKKGVLSTVIYLIVPESATKICSSFGIDSKALLEHDLLISFDILSLFVSTPNDKKQQITEQFKELFKNLLDLSKYVENNDLKLFQIVVIGCLIVGVSACLVYLNKKPSSKNILSGNSSSPQKNPKPVSLSLVVPASVLGGNIKKDYPINIPDIEKLIDNSSYFLCTDSEQADKIQERLELTEENITNVSEQREIYIRINIADAEEMMGKKVPYILKRNLPANGIGVVRELACLKYLSVSGLENFNRII